MYRGTVTLLALALGLGAFASTSWAAACRGDQTLAPIGSVQTDDAVISTSGREVRLAVVSCTGTACAAGFYDADSLDEATAANFRLEMTEAASKTIILPQSGFFEQPIKFQNGISFVDDGNVAAVQLYECTQR